jgi:hypothetical protein
MKTLQESILSKGYDGADFSIIADDELSVIIRRDIFSEIIVGIGEANIIFLNDQQTMKCVDQIWELSKRCKQIASEYGVGSQTVVGREYQDFVKRPNHDFLKINPSAAKSWVMADVEKLNEYRDRLPYIQEVENILDGCLDNYAKTKFSDLGFSIMDLSRRGDYLLVIIWEEEEYDKHCKGSTESIDIRDRLMRLDGSKTKLVSVEVTDGLSSSRKRFARITFKKNR